MHVLQLHVFTGVTLVHALQLHVFTGVTPTLKPLSCLLATTLLVCDASTLLLVGLLPGCDDLLGLLPGYDDLLVLTLVRWPPTPNT